MIMDTLRFSKLLQDKGHFSLEQANTLAESIGTITTETLATKTDIAGLKAETKAEFAELRAETKAEFAELRAETKAEFVRLKAETKAEFAELRAETRIEIGKLRNEISELKSELLKWVIGAIGFQTLVIIGAVVTLARMNGK